MNEKGNLFYMKFSWIVPRFYEQTEQLFSKTALTRYYLIKAATPLILRKLEY